RRAPAHLPAYPGPRSRDRTAARPPTPRHRPPPPAARREGEARRRPPPTPATPPAANTATSGRRCTAGSAIPPRGGAGIDGGGARRPRGGHGGDSIRALIRPPLELQPLGGRGRAVVPGEGRRAGLRRERADPVGAGRSLEPPALSTDLRA